MRLISLVMLGTATVVSGGEQLRNQGVEKMLTQRQHRNLAGRAQARQQANDRVSSRQPSSNNNSNQNGNNNGSSRPNSSNSGMGTTQMQE
jgi:hypothetical protein